ncbi:MAG TPA: hypothetical protein VNX67_02245 [Solirubrobacteraceae bacterium]|jgi:hypothetical protein|nr:hypothetical protein [Solirubrobacteraceae bacterium]
MTVAAALLLVMPVSMIFLFLFVVDARSSRRVRGARHTAGRRARAVGIASTR